MIRIGLFGGFSIDGLSDMRSSLHSQRRAGAALAVLAVSGDLGCTRERLTSLLWPENDESSARHNLRDTLHVIRKALGSGTLLSAADIVRLDSAAVTSDVQRFSAALKLGELEKAAAIYRGPLLDGFHIDEARGFERWVDEERSRLLRECIEALKRLAKSAELDERWDAASEWWARAVELDRFNTRFVVRHMVTLARAGDRANAVLEGEKHAKLLEDELELKPDESFYEQLQRIREGLFGPANFFTPGTRLDALRRPESPQADS